MQSRPTPSNNAAERKKRENEQRRKKGFFGFFFFFILLILGAHKKNLLKADTCSTNPAPSLPLEPIPDLPIATPNNQVVLFSQPAQNQEKFETAIAAFAGPDLKVSHEEKVKFKARAANIDVADIKGVTVMKTASFFGKAEQQLKATVTADTNSAADLAEIDVAQIDKKALYMQTKLRA